MAMMKRAVALVASFACCAMVALWAFETDAHFDLPQLRGNSKGRRLNPGAGGGFGGYFFMFCLQCGFGYLLYVTVVSKYVGLQGTMQDPSRAAAIMSESPVCRINGSPTCLQSFFCYGGMQGLVFHATGIMDYWPALILSSIAPCCMAFYGHSFSDLNQKLGGQQEGPLTGLLLSMCCPFCSIGRNVEALDAATGQQTECFKLTGGSARDMSLPMATPAATPASAPAPDCPDQYSNNTAPAEQY